MIASQVNCSQFSIPSYKYLNNIVERDHRAIKRGCTSMTGFKSFDNAAITILGIELAHRISKRQFSFGVGGPRRERSLKVPRRDSNRLAWPHSEEPIFLPSHDAQNPGSEA